MKNDLKKVCIKISGVNLSRIFKECENQKIALYDVERMDYKNIQFKVDLSQKDNIKQIAKTQKYRYQEVENFGINKVKNFARNHIGLLVGFAIFFAFLIFSTQFVWNIKIYGNQKVLDEQIFEVLRQNNVEIGSFSRNVDIENLEKEILNSIDDISLCSIIKKGSSIVINIKEKLHSPDYENFQSEQDIIANCNMQINEIVVTQGTAKIRAGDSVKAGDVIVAGYFFDTNGQKVLCKANASIKATTWYSETVEFEKEKQVSKRTGKKTFDGYMTIFGQKFVVKNAKNDFENYETEQSVKYVFNNNFLPVKYVKTTYYEIVFEKVVQNFESEKDKITKSCENLAVSKLKDGEIASRVFTVIDEQIDKFIITSYAQVEIEF